MFKAPKKSFYLTTNYTNARFVMTPTEFTLNLFKIKYYCLFNFGFYKKKI